MFVVQARHSSVPCIEFMVHCGYPSLPGEGDDFSQSSERQFELEFLCSDAFQRISQSYDLISWRQLSSFKTRKLRIAFITPMKDATGNKTTALRLADGWRQQGCHVSLIDCATLAGVADEQDDYRSPQLDTVVTSGTA